MSDDDTQQQSTARMKAGDYYALRCMKPDDRQIDAFFFFTVI